MEEVRQLVQEEGREARNIVAFHVSVDPPGNKIFRKPPRAPPSPMTDMPPSLVSPPPSDLRAGGEGPPQHHQTLGRKESGKDKKQSQGPCGRVRSASTGRDKRSELQARYWGLLFGNLQRAIGEIYSTVEAHENMSECQEVILVLENYTRDFKSLCEWFRLKWEYDNTPPPQRPLSLAWEVRKTSPAKPEIRRARSCKSSPSVSGKNSPSVSGKNSPCPPAGKISPSLSSYKIHQSSGKTSPHIALSCLSPKQKSDANNPFFSKADKIIEGIILDRNLNITKSEGNPELLLDSDKIIDLENVCSITKDSIGISKLDQNDAKQGKDDSVTVTGKATDSAVVKSSDVSGSPKTLPKVEIGTATEFPSLPTPRKAVVIRKKSNKAIENNVENEENSQTIVSKTNDSAKTVIKRNLDVKKRIILPTHVKHTTDILEALENEHLKSINSKLISEETVIASNESQIDMVSKMNAKNILLCEELEKNLLGLSCGYNKQEIDKEDPSFENTNLCIVVDSVEESSIKNSESEEQKTSEISQEKAQPEENYVANREEEKETDNTLIQCTVKDTSEKKDKVEHGTTLSKPAYSQAASKPKSATISTLLINKDQKHQIPSSNISKHVTQQNNRMQNKTPVTDNKMMRSKTIAEIKQGPCRRVEIKTPNRNNTRQPTSRNVGSYPFNLTVGRGTLFENSSTRSNNNLNKGEILKSRVAANNSRPNYLPIKKENQPAKGNANPPDKNEKQNNGIENENKSSNFLQPSFQSSDAMYSSSETIVNSRLELCHVESNESIKTLCPDNENIYNGTFAGSVEVLNIIDNGGVISEKGGNDGWLTVKSRRLNKNSQSKKSSSHWANRYHQPSATASLPTLNMIESPKEGLSKLNDFVKLEITVENNTVLSKDKDVEEKKTEMVKQKKEKKVEPKKNQNVKVNTNMVRQKSDITGLKSKKSRTSLKDSVKNFTRDLNLDEAIQNLSAKEKVVSDHEYLPRSKKFKNKYIKMHFSSEDLSECKISPVEEEDDDKKQITDCDKCEIVNTSKNITSLHLSLESLNSDSCTSVSLERITTLNEKLTSSEISIDTDSLKQNSLNKSSEVYDGDNDEESKDILTDNLDSEANEIEMMTNQIEENERKMDLALDWQSEEDQRKLSEEEELLNQQIQELQQGSDFDIDTETDDTETDGEILCEEDEEANEDSLKSERDKSHSKQSWYSSSTDSSRNVNEGCNPDDNMSLEDRYEPILSSMTWVERMDVLAALESLVSRDPGRAQQLHAKLSHSMRRRGSLQETLRRYQAKQARAEHHRRALQKERATKLHQLLARVEDVKAAKVQLIEEKRLRMEQRLQRAAENRDQRLKDIVRKAHDEDEKLREIAFIKQLEAANKRHDFLVQCREQTSRLREVRADRMRRLEEKAAKEAAVEERKKALETERILKLDKMRESRRQREERVGRQQLQKEKERAQLAEEKARGRSERLSALLAAQAATAQALRRRISLKQRETAKRHQQTISLIKQRALELSSQRPEPGATQEVHTNRNKTICEIHGRGKSSTENAKKKDGSNNNSRESSVPLDHANSDDNGCNEKCTLNGIEESKGSSKEKHKAQKKKLKKIKQRMFTRAQEFEATYEFPATEAFSTKSKMSRSINQIANIVQRQHHNSANTQHINTIATSRSQNIMKNGSLDSRLGGSAHSSMSDLSKNSSSKSEGFINGGGGNLNQLDRFLGELSRIMEKQINPSEKLAWQKLNGFSILNDILSTGTNEKENFTDISTKTLVTTSNLYRMACHSCPQNCDYVILSNKIISVIDLMLQRLQCAVSSGTPCPLATALQRATISTLRHATSAVASRMNDIVSYVVGSGLVELVSQVCGSAEDPTSPGTCDLVESSLDLLAALAEKCAKDSQTEGCQRLGAALRSTEMGGALSCMCCALSDPAPEAALPAPALRLSAAALGLLTSAAIADFPSYQESLSGGAALQFRQMASRLLRHAARSPDTADPLLYALLPAIGYFALNSEENQNLLTAGTPPCVVQQLSTLPFRYFSGAGHARLLLPTLIVCSAGCPSAQRLLRQELSQQLLDDFKNSECGKKSRLLSLMKQDS